MYNIRSQNYLSKSVLTPHFMTKSCIFTCLISKFCILIINSNYLKKSLIPINVSACTHPKLRGYSLISRKVRQLLFLIRHSVSPLILVNPSFRYAIPIRRDI